ncbi:MAG: nickel-dependent hydrogenase large subunit [Planctomycetota bacterium]
MGKVIIDPITRIEGHLKIEAVVENGKVKEAHSSGTLWRGIELILQGRHPLDALQITQRVCGVCPQGHSQVSALNIDSALGISDKIPKNGRLLRNLILGSNFIQSHILHFYTLAALDYVDVAACAKYTGKNPDILSIKNFVEAGELGPFVPRYDNDFRLSDELNQELSGNYVKALKARRVAQEMLTIFGGKMPHNMAVIAGGVTERPTVSKIAQFLGKLKELQEFIDTCYIPDVIAVAKAYGDYFSLGKGCGQYLAYGVFDLEEGNKDYLNRKRLLPSGAVNKNLNYQSVNASKILEHVRHSWYKDQDPTHPSKGETQPQYGKTDAYSWLKSPRYEGEVYEVGPLSRMVSGYLKGEPKIKQLVDDTLASINGKVEYLFSILGRHAARALETKLVADTMLEWVPQLEVGAPVFTKFEIPQTAEGAGLSEAPRGALGHWITIKDSVISKYQLVVPTTWNASPRDSDNVPGPIEQAIEGLPVKDENKPVEIVRAVRSFDPCIACAVHIVTPTGMTKNVVKI